METKKAVSVSLGSYKRDKAVDITLLGKQVRLERIGTNGDEKEATRLFTTLDGKVDALGVGGIALHINLPWKSYPLRAGVKLVKEVKITPYTDGTGIQTMLESRVMQYVLSKLKEQIPVKKAFLVEGISRYGMVNSFLDTGFDCVFGDLMFALGIPLAIRTRKGVNLAAKLLLPFVAQMPISMLYSTGESQDVVVPKYIKYYHEASVIAGDWLYIKKHMPEDMEGKIIVTNTTTEEDVEFMRSRGIAYLVTTTPGFAGRSFGTNAFEAALTAAAGLGRTLTFSEISSIIEKENIKPQIRKL
jgi:hypothetical protein